MPVCQPLRIETVFGDDALVVVPEGELDIATSPLLDEALERARASEAATIVVDLRKISFIDSTGLHVLIKHAREDGHRARIRLMKGSPQIQRIFQLSGAVEFLPFVSEEGSARDSRRGE